MQLLDFLNDLDCDIVLFPNKLFLNNFRAALRANAQCQGSLLCEGWFIFPPTISTG